MPQAVDSVTLVVEQLSQRLRDLESRIASLESFILSGANTSLTPQVPQRESPRPQPAPTPVLARPTRHGLPVLESSARAFPTIGKAVLGFAGAFLLRALAESGSVPKLPVLIIAILYACFWMIWSARITNRFASVTYALTSTLILSPMLWEATVRFHSMPASASASTLVAFMILTLVLASRHELQVIPWIATLAAASTAIALIIGTRELMPLTLALLAIAAACETSVCLGHELTFRIIPAIVADFTLWLCVYILGSNDVPEGYRAVAPATLIALCAVLPAIYGIAIGFRVFVQRQPISVFEIAQLAASFGLAAFGMMRASHNAAAPALGLIFLLLAAVCYWATLWRFAALTYTRNRRVSASWAAALLVAGTFLLLPDNFQIPFLCTAALLTAVLYTRTAKLSLGLHASFYLASAAAVSSLPLYVWNSLAGTVPASPDWRAWTVALSAGLCYAVESRKEVDEGRSPSALASSGRHRRIHHRRLGGSRNGPSRRRPSRLGRFSFIDDPHRGDLYAGPRSRSSLAATPSRTSLDRLRRRRPGHAQTHVGRSPLRQSRIAGGFVCILWTDPDPASPYDAHQRRRGKAIRI